MPEQVQPEAGVVEEGQVCAGIAQADDAVRMGEHAADCGLVGIEQGRRENGLQLVGDGQVEHRVERVAALGRRDVGDGALFMVRQRRAGGFDDMHLVPFRVEEAEGGGGRELSAHAVAKVLARQHGDECIALQAERGLPAHEPLDRVWRLHREVHRQRAARDLADQRMASGVGRSDGVEVIEHRLRVGAVVQQRGDHHRAAAVGGQRFKKRQRRVAALRQHEDAVAALGHRHHQRMHLAVVGQARGHRQPALAVVRRRGAAREADRAGLHRFAHDALHGGHLGIGGAAFRGVVAHHVGPHAAVADVGGDVDRTSLAAQLRQVLGKGLEAPRDAGLQHAERHALDLGQVAHRDVAVGGLARRDGEAAIADHGRRHAQRRRGPNLRIPGDLGIEMGVAVDDARHQRQAVGLDHLAGRHLERAAHGCDAACADGHVADHGCAARAVEDQCAAEKDIVQGSTSLS